MSVMFARYVQDKRRSRPLFYASLVVAGLIEGAVVAYFLVSFLMKVVELTPPPLYTMLVTNLQIPPPPPPPVVTANTTPRRDNVRRGSRLRQPKLDAQPAQLRQPPVDLEPGPPGDSPDAPPIPGDGLPQGPPMPPLPPPIDVPPQTPKKVPVFLIKKQQLFGPDPHLPAAVKQQRRGQNLTGTYLVCIDKSGRVSDVNTMMGIPGADEEIGNTLRTWRYKEQLIPVCFVQNFEFIVE